MSDDRLMLRRDVVGRRDVDLRDHEHVHRRLGPDVAEGERLVVLVHDVGGDFTIDDAAEGRGSVTFGVYVLRDGKLSEAYKSDIVRGGEAPQRVSVDVAGAQGMTLVVDYAERGDEMDRADWLDARLVKAED